jgi:predicted dehydrogenase
MGYARLSDTIHVPTEMLNWSGHSGPEWFLFPAYHGRRAVALRRNPVEVYAKGYRGVLESRASSAGTPIQTMIEFEGRAFCTFETSWILPNSYSNVVDNRLSIYGETGGLELRTNHRSGRSPTASIRRFRPRQSHATAKYGLPVRIDSLLRRLRADDVMPEAGGAMASW